MNSSHDDDMLTDISSDESGTHAKLTHKEQVPVIQVSDKMEHVKFEKLTANKDNLRLLIHEEALSGPTRCAAEE